MASARSPISIAPDSLIVVDSTLSYTGSAVLLPFFFLESEVGHAQW